jgi:uncharacterized membrane protein
MKSISKIYNYLIILFALIGLGAMIYLPLDLNNTVPNSCNINPIFNCAKVAASPYSSYFGIPLYVYGWVFFSIILVLIALNTTINDSIVRKYSLYSLVLVSVLGAIAISYLIYLVVIKIGTSCLFCDTSYVSEFIILALVLRIFTARKRRF